MHSPVAFDIFCVALRRVRVSSNYSSTISTVPSMQKGFRLQKSVLGGRLSQTRCDPHAIVVAVQAAQRLTNAAHVLMPYKQT